MNMNKSTFMAAYETLYDVLNCNELKESKHYDLIAEMLQKYVLMMTGFDHELAVVLIGATADKEESFTNIEKLYDLIHAEDTVAN